MSVPSNLIPTRITQLPTAPVADEDSLMMIVYQGNNYKIRVGDLLSVAGVPITTQVIAGTGLTGGGALSGNVTLSVAVAGIGATQLNTTGVTSGVYGNATNIPVFTVDTNGRLATATTVPAAVPSVTGTVNQIAISAGPTVAIASDPVLPGSGGVVVPAGTTGQRGTSTLGNFRFNSTTSAFEGYNGAWNAFAAAGVTSVATGTGLTGGPITSTGTISIDVTGVTATTYGSSSVVPVIAVNAQGQITSATNTTINAVTLTTGTISTTPSASTDIANKSYVDTVAQGLDTKASVVAGTTANITLSGTQTIDGVVLVVADRVLVKNQTLPQNNGLYLCAAGAWTRTTDMNTWDQVPGAYVFIEGGTTLADTGWVCTSNAGGTLGTTAITWAQFSGAGSGVSSITFGTTGLTPATATTGAVTVAGTLAVANGGTGVTTSTGTTNVVLSNSPTLVTPALGAATATSIVSSGTAASSFTVTSGSAVPLTITNVGTGNSFVVEDSASTDGSPFVITAGGQVIMGFTAQLSGAQFNPSLEVFGADSSESGIGQFQYGANTSAARYQFNKTRGATAIAQTVVVSGDELGTIQFAGSDGTGYIRGALIRAEVDGTPGTNDMPGRLVFSTTADGASSPTERMRIDSAGNVGIGAVPIAQTSLYVVKTLTGGTTGYGIYASPTNASDVTANIVTYLSFPATANAVTQVCHYRVAQGTFTGAVTNQFGMEVQASLTGATNNYGFHSNIASGTNRFNFYANGTADNYFAGKVGIGIVPSASYNVRIKQNATGGSGTEYYVASEPTFQSDVTATAYAYMTSPSTQATAFTLANLIHYGAAFSTLGAGSSVTNQMGFVVQAGITGATNNYGFRGRLAAASGVWNLYMDGTAANLFSGVSQFAAGTAALPGITQISDLNTGIYFPAADTLGFTTGGSERVRIDSAGNVGIGGTATTVSLYINKNITGGAASYASLASGTTQSDVTTVSSGFVTSMSTASAAFTLSNLRHFFATQATIGATSVVTSQIGYFVENSLTGATNNYGFYSNIASGTNRFNFYAAGTADNYFAGNVGIGAVPTSAAKANITSTSAGASTIALSLQNASATIGSETVLDLVATNAGTGVRSAQITAINTDGSTGVNMVFKISNGAPAVECMRISSAGVFLFNNTVVNGQSTARGIQNNSTTVLESFSTTAGTAQLLTFTKSANATAGSQTLVSNADALGVIRSFGSDGTAYRQATQIQFNVDGGTPSSTSMPGRITFSTSASGSVSPTERIRIDSAGLTTVTGTLKVTTGAAVGGATAGTGGLAFPATAVAVADANTLDDYEEGTWTPVVTFSGGNGDLTTAEANGVYTKIGRLVQIAFNVEFTETTALTNLTITGVPFTSGGTVRTFVGCWVDNMTALVGSPVAGLGTSTTTISMQTTGTGAAALITNLNTAASSRVRGSLSYSI